MVKKRKNLFKFTMLAALSAIGVVLMSYIQIPYPLAPFLKIEFSDFVVIFAFLLFGFKDALVVAIVKTLGDIAFRGPVGPYAVGQITALVASLSYVLGLWIANLIFKRKGVGFQIIKYVFTTLVVTFILTFANYFFLTPIFLGKFSFLDMSADALSYYTGVNSYFLSIVILYVPFNLLKGTCVSIIGISIGDTLLRIYQKRMEGKEILSEEKEEENHEEIS